MPFRIEEFIDGGVELGCLGKIKRRTCFCLLDADRLVALRYKMGGGMR
jgi:hypothetical protein